MRALGVDVEVVSPASFPHFGIAFGGGIAQNLRAAPWRLALVPAFLAAYARAARRAARDADLVHAHWIPSAIAARATGKPYVLQVWGTDVALARRVPALVRPLVRGARLVIAASTFLADEARALGARAVEVVPAGVAIPERGRRARRAAARALRRPAERGEGDPRVPRGDRGPAARDRRRRAAARTACPRRSASSPPTELGAYYERAAVVCVPSRREGYGITAREAMAYGRPVVATRVGGLGDLDAGRDAGCAARRGGAPTALERLLGDKLLRTTMGAAAREAASDHFSLIASAERLADVYERAAR